MNFTAIQIASLIKATIDGNPQDTINSFGQIETAKQGQLTFFANAKYEDFLYQTEASIILINESFVPKIPLKATLLKVPNAYEAFATLLAFYQKMQTEQLVGQENPIVVAKTAVLGANVYIGAFSYIADNVEIGSNTKVFQQVYIGQNVQIGKNCIIHPGVTIYANCRLGNNIIIHSNTVIGSDGFGFVQQENKAYKKIPHIGKVIIEDDVEIGANCTIDRGTIGATVIGQGVKMDNLIQIAHNVTIGKHTVIAAQAGVSGSSTIGAEVVLGGQVGIVGHITIADGCKINGQSGVGQSVTEKNKTLTGTPAFDYISTLKSQALLRNLPLMEKRLLALEKKLSMPENG